MSKGISGKLHYCALVFTGPTWLKRDGTVLVASRRFDGSRSRKTKGSLADTLQCNIWRRAQTPHRMTHSLHGGENNDNGFTALGKKIGTPKSSDKDCAYVTEHPVLKYLQPKLANFRERELFPLGKCDDDGRPGTGSKLYYISSWAMCWPTDHPKRPVTG